MQVTIIKRNKLSVFTLPEEISGSHWITDFENGKKINLINVDATEEGWSLISNDDAFVVDNSDVMVPNVVLKEYNFYLIKNNYKNEKYYLYCGPIYDKTFKEFGINGTITVGSSTSCDITYKLGGIPSKSFLIEKKDKYLYLTILDANSSVYVNQQRVIISKRIEYGDIIFTFGLKLILMRRDGRDYLLVNNPNNLLEYNASFVNVVNKPNDFVEDNMELTDDTIFNDDSYFYRTPHFYKTLKKFELNIDAPPAKKEEDKTPLALTIGPMMTMALTSGVMVMTNLSKVTSGETSLKSSLPSLITSGAMLLSSLLWPLLTKAYKKYADKMYEKKRQKLYRKYIDKKEDEITLELEKQRKSLLENNFTVIDCQNVIRGHNVKLWQRRITDEDFLTLPVGVGNVPMQIDIKYPEEHFSLTEDNLLDVVHNLGKKERILNDVPITFSFYENFVTGIVGDSMVTKDFIDRLMLQVMANYSYDEVKVVTFTSNENESGWNYIKTIPHSWSNDKSLRFFGSDNEEYREIIYTLDKIYNDRKNSKSKQRYDTHYVIVTDAIKSIDNFDFIKNIMNDGKEYGFSVIMLVDKLSALPNECKNFITVSRQECSIFSSVLNSDNQKFRIDFSSIEEIYNCAKELANIPMKINTEVETSLPDMYQFLEMYQVGKIEQLNSNERWKKNNPILSLQAPIGIGKSGEIITLDLHEKYHGPHGLIAGTTGSGKSEFIITYILSLAVNYHPNEVQIILIDYKGGSLAGAFVNDNYRLPHVVGTITNLDGNELNRSLASIESEVKRRQRVFNEAKKIANESTIDIYKYQKLWREGRLKDMEPVAHLFIISDEFAELKEQQPEFMDKLISVARVGRSLGVHLILATQKPGGVVDSQIWSNSRFKICLKVQDTTDSQEVLKKPDAAYLKKTGRFYLQVGYDEVYTLGQSAWAGGQYYPNTTFKKEIDTSINLINNIGFVTSTKEAQVVEKTDSLGEELPNIVKYLGDIAYNQKLDITPLWLESMPGVVYVDKLKEKYNYQKTDFVLNPVVGEYDEPHKQRQSLLTVPLSKDGNFLLYGASGSGKELFLTTLLYSLITTYTPEELGIYILDFGTEVLNNFNDSSHVGDIIHSGDDEKIDNLFKFIKTEIDIRRKQFLNYNGNYEDFIAQSDKRIPNIVVVINQYDIFAELYEQFSEKLYELARECNKYGIYFVLSASNTNAVRSKLLQNFKTIYTLQLNNEFDYRNIYGNTGGVVPSKIYGRGIFKGDSVLEFQTAYAFPKDDLYKNILATSLKTYMNFKTKMKPIPVLPKEVTLSNLTKDKIGLNFIPVGMVKKDLGIANIKLKDELSYLISFREFDDNIPFIDKFLHVLEHINLKTFVLDSKYIYESSDFKNVHYYNNNFSPLLNNLNKFVNDVSDVLKNNNNNIRSIRDIEDIMVVIVGFNKFIESLSKEDKDTFINILTKAKDILKVHFVFIDIPAGFKPYEYESWYKTSINASSGLWVGNGFADQYLIKPTKVIQSYYEIIDKNFGYIVLNGQVKFIKLIEKI